MSHEAKNKSVKVGRKLYEISDTQNIEQEIILPDYCKEIKKLLKCTLIPGIHSVSLSGEKATAKGTGVIRVVYLGEGDEVDVFEKSCDLSSSVQMKDVPSASAIKARQKTDFLNCRVMGQRKLLVSAGVSTVFSCFCVGEEKYICESQKESIRTKTQKLECEEISSFFEKTFDMSETVVLNTEHPSVGKIISCDSICTLESKKFSSGKLLLKGEVKIDICYLPEKTANTFHRMTHTMPISQIIDIGEGSQNTEYDVALESKQLLCNLKSDSSGSNRLIELLLRVSAFIAFFEKKHCEVITDCYCTDLEIETDYSQPDFYRPLRRIDETTEQKCEIDFSSPIKEICFAKCLEVSEKLNCSANRATVSCSALIGIIYLDEKGIPSYCEKNADFEIAYSVMAKCRELSGNLDVDALSVVVSPLGNEKAQVTLNCKVRGRLYCKHESRILKKLSVLEDKPKKDKGAALTVYFPEKGEKLWDIARNHNTTVELIMQENGITDENDVRQQMLLIPCV